jgi:hypothetical protein
MLTIKQTARQSASPLRPFIAGSTAASSPKNSSPPALLGHSPTICVRASQKNRPKDILTMDPASVFGPCCSVPSGEIEAIGTAGLRPLSFR